MLKFLQREKKNITTKPKPLKKTLNLGKEQKVNTLKQLSRKLHFSEVQQLTKSKITVGKKKSSA